MQRNTPSCGTLERIWHINCTKVRKPRKRHHECVQTLFLGIHDDCASYFCKKSTDPDAPNTLKILKETGLYYEVMDLCQSYFGNNVKSLVAGLCTNKTEGFNSLIAKTIGILQII